MLEPCPGLRCECFCHRINLNNFESILQLRWWYFVPNSNLIKRELAYLCVAAGVVAEVAYLSLSADEEPPMVGMRSCAAGQ